MSGDEQDRLWRILGNLESHMEQTIRDRRSQMERHEIMDKRLTDLHNTFMTPNDAGKTLAQEIREIVADTKIAARERTRAVQIVRGFIMLTPAVALAWATWRGWITDAAHFMTGNDR